MHFIRRFLLRCLAATVATAIAGGAAGSPSALHAQELPLYTVREDWRIVSNEASRDMQLTSVVGLTVLPDGRLVTSHRSEAMLRVFDSAGRLIRTVGRRGQGPGEFSNPAGVGYVGDTIWVRDGPQWKLFNRDFVPIGQLTAPATGGQFIGVMSGGKTFGVFGSALTNSRSVAIGSSLGPLGASPSDSRSIDLRTDPPPAGTAPAVPVRTVRQMVDVGRGGAPQQAPGPFATLTWVALAPGGREAVVIEPARIWNGRPGQLTIRRLSPDWRISDTVTVSLPPRRMTKQRADSGIAEWARLRSYGPDIQRRVEVPEYLEPFASVEYFADGLLWMSEEDVYGDTRLVVGVDGRPRMRVKVPRDFNIRYATATHVWGTLRDADDLPIIVRYRLMSLR